MALTSFPLTSARPLFVALLLAAWSAPAAAAELHPLDPLSAEEIASAISVIAASGRVNPGTRAAIVTLLEPEKSEVLKWWKAGDPVRRRAFSVLRVDGETYEAVVDLGTSALESWTHVSGVQPAIQSGEWAAAQRIVKADPRWQAAMHARGYNDFTNIFCESLSAGNFGLSGEKGRRLLKMPCYDIAGAKINIYARPIEGLVATVDLDAGAVLNVLDEGVVPVGATPHEFDEASVPAVRAPMHPVRMVAPDGWNFTIKGRVVEWQGWSFHLGFDQRFGPVLSLVEYADGNAPRMVLYQGYVSEVFVPYMDESPTWSFRTYLDAGEFGFGTLASPLAPGIDCPEGAVFLDATLASATGRAYNRERVICVFERDPGAPIWRHYEALNSAYEGRRATELVVRSISSIAHYDYVIDWVFTQSAAIRVNIGATGIDAVKGSVAGAGANGHRGALVAPGLVAVHHDHYFSLRLDLDIDGAENRFVREQLQPVTLPEASARRSLWQVVPEILAEETALSAGPEPEVWRVENPLVTTSLGNHPGYQIEGVGPVSLLSADDWPQRRASFSAANLWVTKRHPGELYAAGAYPNQSRGGDGLPTYANREDIRTADLVVWATIGFHHVTRPEDWPVMTTVWQGVTLRPYGFFTENPALGVRRAFADPPG
jgi:primary-amine oxidase